MPYTYEQLLIPILHLNDCTYEKKYEHMRIYLRMYQHQLFRRVVGNLSFFFKFE